MSQDDKGKETTPVKMDDVKDRAEEKKCPVQKALVFVQEFLAGPMCGKCFPCSFGSYEARIRLQRFLDGSATEEDRAILEKIASQMQVASMCKKGKDTAKYVAEHMGSKEFVAHLSGRCEQKACTHYLRYIIIPEKCQICGICQEACKFNAIIGEKKKPYLSGYSPYEIIQKRCNQCGECIKVCPYDAIELLSTEEMADKEPVGT